MRRETNEAQKRQIMQLSGMQSGPLLRAVQAGMVHGTAAPEKQGKATVENPDNAIKDM